MKEKQNRPRLGEANVAAIKLIQKKAVSGCSFAQLVNQAVLNGLPQLRKQFKP